MEGHGLLALGPGKHGCVIVCVYDGVCITLSLSKFRSTVHKAELRGGCYGGTEELSCMHACMHMDLAPPPRTICSLQRQVKAPKMLRMHSLKLSYRRSLAELRIPLGEIGGERQKNAPIERRIDSSKSQLSFKITTYKSTIKKKSEEREKKAKRQFPLPLSSFTNQPSFLPI